MHEHEHGHSHVKEAVIFFLLVGVAVGMMWCTTERENNTVRAQQACQRNGGHVVQQSILGGHWTCGAGR